MTHYLEDSDPAYLLAHTPAGVWFVECVVDPQAHTTAYQVRAGNTVLATCADEMVAALLANAHNELLPNLIEIERKFRLAMALVPPYRPPAS